MSTKRSEPSACATSVSHTRTTWTTFSHEWKVDEFLTRCTAEPVSTDLLTSAIFSPASLDDSIRFYLKLYASYHKNPDYVAVFVHLSNSSRLSPVISNYECSLVDSQGQLCETGKSVSRQFRRGDCWGFPTFIKRSTLVTNAQRYLPANRLILRCLMKCLVGEKPHQEIKLQDLSLQVQMSAKQCADAIGSLLTSGKHSDLRLTVNGRTVFKVHRCIVSVRSSVLGAMCAHTNHLNVTLPNISMNSFEQMLRWMYTGTLSHHFSTDLVELANLYELPCLKSLCEVSLCEQLTTSTAVSLLNLAIQNHCHQLKHSALVYIKRNLDDIRKTKTWQRVCQSAPDWLAEVTNGHECNIPAKRLRPNIKQEQQSFSDDG